jgi:hypothetical protein
VSFPDRFDGTETHLFHRSACFLDGRADPCLAAVESDVRAHF